MNMIFPTFSFWLLFIALVSCTTIVPETLSDIVQSKINEILKDKKPIDFIFHIYPTNSIEPLEFHFRTTISSSDENDPSIPINPPLSADIHFKIGSNTKSMTALILLQLIEQGKIKPSNGDYESVTAALDNDICEWYPHSVMPDCNKITLRHLLNMRSGIENYTELKEEFEDILLDNPQINFSPDDLIAMALERDRQFEPNAEYRYSNTNYVMLGRIIEKVSGEKLKDLIEREILQKLGMTESIFGEHKEILTPFSFGYTLIKDKKDKKSTSDQGRIEIAKVHFETCENHSISFAWATGNVISTMTDLKKWSDAVFSGALLQSKELFKEQMTFVSASPVQEKAGYGFGIVSFDGMTFHTGGLSCYSTFFGKSETNGWTYIAFMNRDDIGISINKIVQEIVKNIEANL